VYCYDEYMDISLKVTIVASQCLPCGKQRMCTRVQPTLTLSLSVGLIRLFYFIYAYANRATCIW